MLEPFYYKHNAALFEDEEKFINKLMVLGSKNICGSIVYERAEDYEIKFKIFKEDDEYWLKILFKGKRVVNEGLGDEWEKVLGNIEYFFGKAPDDDTFLEARRIALYSLFVEDPPKTFDESDERYDFMDLLFGTNL